MATRRTTRGSAAAANTNENSTTAIGAPIQALGVKKPVARKPTITKTSTIPTATTSAIGRKRVLGDVTNATKKSTTLDSTTNNKPSFSKPTIASTSTRRTVRTRSSTGGPDHGDDDVIKEEEEGSDENMVLDAPVPVGSREIKSLRKSGRTVNSSNAMEVKEKKPTISVKARVPLAAKAPNARVTAASRIAAAKLASSTTARQIKERRLAAQKAADAAAEELAAVLREEEEHAAKRVRTSEPELIEVDEEEEEEDDEDQVEMDVMTGRSPVVNGLGMKDEGWIDLDDGDEDDPLMVSSYVVEVYEYMRGLELTTMADVDYMSRQNEVTWKMRGILIDWLVEIHSKFRLLPETIFLATNIIDRFLTTRVVSLVKFQLVGVTALFIASKYEEVVCPSVSNFLYMTDGGYEDDEILKAERYVLNMIDFNLSYPNPINFLRRISKADGYDITSRTLAKYLMEISIVDNKFLGCPPSLIAAAGSWLARKALKKGAWDANLIHYSGYTQDELLPTAQLMLDYVVRASSIPTSASRINNPLRTSASETEMEHPNFIKKYAGKKFFKASTLMRTWAEEEYGPKTTKNRETGKMETTTIEPLL